MHKIIIELSPFFFAIIYIYFFEIILVQKVGELNNKAKTTYFIDSIIKTTVKVENSSPHLKLTLNSMEINKNKNKRKGKTLPSRSIVVGSAAGIP